MGAKLLDWMATHREVVIAFTAGVIVGGVLGMIGAWLR